MTTMLEKDFLPKDEAKLLEWLKNFSSLLPTIGSALGITPAETASLNALISNVKSDIRKGQVNLEERDMKKVVMLKFLRTLVDKMKSHSSYKDTDHGAKLGIIN